jgi:hypothetical protein
LGLKGVGLGVLGGGRWWAGGAARRVPSEKKPTMFATRVAAASTGLAAAYFAPMAFNHCQVPCGIFDDKQRVSQVNNRSQCLL